MRLSIVIVNWNTSDLLAACLQSIESHRPPFEHEVIVVDNASRDFEERSMRAQFPWANFVANPENAGYARGNNQAIERCTGDYVLLLNPDTEMTTGTLDALVEFMDSHPDAAAAGARLLRPDGTVERSVRGFPYPGPIAWELLRLSRLFPRSRVFGAYRMTWFGYDQVAEVDQPMGSCLILRHRAIEEVGLLDEQFPIFFNEVDWLYRARERGWRVYFTPSAAVIHHGAASTKQAGRRKMKKESHDSLLRFYAKHFRGKLSPVTYYLAVAAVKVSRQLKG